jgi:dTDP-4-dehydrorhamnose reductase
MVINGEAPRVLAEEAARLNALLVHYSTDYVFDGTKQTPWVETDEPNPLNVYGQTKLAGERVIQEVGGRYLIFRTSWVYGPHGHNFLLTMLRLGRERDQLRIVDDQFGAPTSSIEIARVTQMAVARILTAPLAEDWHGIYHMTCAGKTTWCEFARAIFQTASASRDRDWPNVIEISSKEYPTPARRPKNSVLANVKLNSELGVTLPDWRLALQDALQVLAIRHA